MSSSWWKFGLLAAVFFFGGCDCKDRIQSLVYEDVDRTITPTQQREEQGENREVEPNDTPEQATPIVLQRDMGAMYGSIDPAQDVDWFAMEVGGEEDWIVEVTVTPQDSSLDIALYLEVPGDADYAPLLYDIAGAGEAESIPMVRVPAGGTQRFFLSSVDGTSGEYRINIRRRLSAGAVAVEPNDYPHLASPLEIPGEMQGFYDRPHDRDVFYVPAESLKAAVYSLELSNIAGVEQTLEIYGDKELESPLMSIPVAENRPAIIPNLSLASGAEAGLYFVLSAGEKFDRDRSYRLRIIEHPPARGYIVEREPNDTEGSAHLVELGDRVRGYLHTSSDVDRFRFVIEPSDEGEEDAQDDDDELLAEYRGSAGDPDEEEPEIDDPWAAVPEKEAPEYVVQVHLRPLGDAHRFAMRWLPDEESSEQRRELQAESEEEGLILCNHVLGPGEYDVELRALETQEGFRPRSFDYEIQFMNLATESEMEVEPNNTPEQADRLPMGSSRVGYISYDGDVDLFAFIVGPDEPVVVEDETMEEGSAVAEQDGDGDAEDDTDGDEGVAVAGPATVWQPPPTENVQIRLEGNRLNLGFEVIDDEGGRVANVNRAGPGADEELAIDLPHGLYYLAVSAASGSLCEPYRISVAAD